MKITQLYDDYQIMPNLREHQLRVAAVASKICELLPSLDDPQSVIGACLTHDMGNIVKFDFNLFPEFTKPEGVAYWSGVQKKYMDKYGSDPHVVTLAILKEAGLSPTIVSLVKGLSFPQVSDSVADFSLPEMICEYSDCRVVPKGIVSLQERLADLEKRYAAKYPTWADQKRRQAFAKLLVEIEEQIFSQIEIDPWELTDQSLNDRITELKKFEFN